MDAELISLASTAAATLVALLTTDSWERAKDVSGEWWRKVHPADADGAAAALSQSRADIEAAGQAGGGRLLMLREALEDEWRGRLRHLLAVSPGLAAELRQLVDSELTPMLVPPSPPPAGGIALTATASGCAIVNQVGQGSLNIGRT